MKRSIELCFLACGILLAFTGCAQKKAVATPSAAHQPKLIVGITVDQMRYDYIERFWNDFSDKGFKRLVSEGFFARNVQYNYMPTYTGPGHAAIYTGTTPPYNGIIANDWYDRYKNDTLYCAGDDQVQGVGTSAAGGKMSPKNLISTTLGDEIKQFTNQRGKVIGISLKDRGAILPAGRTADAAYWFLGAEEGNWVSSSWYMSTLPEWVTSFNSKHKADQYLNQVWDLKLPANQYEESIEDNNAYEINFKGLTRPVFPYDLKSLRGANLNYELLKSTPFGNTLTREFAEEAIVHEKLGQDNIVDMLCLSFSATDYIGHQFGIHSKEVQDCYVRLDEELALLIDNLDKQFGRDNYLLFLSADHGGAPTPGYMNEKKGAGGYWKSDKLEIAIDSVLSAKYGAGKWVKSEINQNIFLDHDLIKSKNLELGKLQREVNMFVGTRPEVYMSFNAADLDRESVKKPIAQKVQMGYSEKYSGDVIYVLNPDYMEYGLQGTTHGSPFVYDSHVPALFFGFKVKHGETHVAHSICDIAPTIAALCNMTAPSACIGEPIEQITE